MGQATFAGVLKRPRPRGQPILLEGTNLAPLQNNKQTHNEFSLFPQKYVMYKMSLTIFKIKHILSDRKSVWRQIDPGTMDTISQLLNLLMRANN
jgi:hypothetical protein